MKRIILFTTVILFLSIPISAMAGPPLPPPPPFSVRVTIPLPPPIVFPAPPEVVVVPETEVYVVPSVPEEIFFYNGYWWRPWNGRWYRSLYYDRGWVVYAGVPFWYNRIPRDWRENYRNHLWGGHPWNYHPIHYNDLRRNWRTWHNTHYWNKPEHREFTHYHDGRLYGSGKAKTGATTQGKVGTTGRSKATTQGSVGQGTTTGQGKPGTGGHTATGTKVYTPEKTTKSSGKTTKGEHTKETEEKK
jgi:hypothetical protein